MNWSNKYLLILALVSLCCCKRGSKSTASTLTASTTNQGNYKTLHLIEPETLLAQWNTNTYKLIDFGKKEEYNQHHLPGALNIWRTDIEDTTYPYRGMMASKTQVEMLFSSLGIGNKDTLVVYDRVSSCDAARLWWLLKNYGFNQVKILNGGLTGWKNTGGPLTDNPPKLAPSNFTFGEDQAPSFHISKQQMLKAIDTAEASLILDTRTASEFYGQRQKEGAQVAGRIPGSIHMDWINCVNHSDDQKFKDYKTLDSLYSEHIPSKETPVIAYCHTGVRSAHTTFVLSELLGYKNIKNYDGSWTEWSYFEDLPKQKDSVTTVFN